MSSFVTRLSFSPGERIFIKSYALIFHVRSEYFRALLADHFSECREEGPGRLPTVPLSHTPATVFSCVVQFVYTDDCDVSEESVLELLQTADMFLLPGLTKLCGNMLSNLIHTNTVLDILHTARLFK